MHFHWSKMEDIINRGGGNVLIRVYNSTEDEDLDREREVHVHVDGREMGGSGGNSGAPDSWGEHYDLSLSLP